MARECRMTVKDVLDSAISYVEVGAGAPLVFLHGNPTSSYLWRGVIPQIAVPARRLAPDLIGMGDSGKPPIAYSFTDHARYMDAWFDALDLDDVVLVGHDWGGALAFDWATRHPERVRGLVFMETIVRPMSWDDFPEPARPMFTSLRTPGAGETMVLDENWFIEQALPFGTIAGKLSAEDMDAYRKPYPTRDSRVPLLQWPRQFPIDGEPAETLERVEAYDGWLARSRETPKLLLTFEGGPGLMMGPSVIDWCRQNIASLRVQGCGAAGHHAPEDQPDAIAAAITDWLGQDELRPHPATDVAADGSMRAAHGVAEPGTPDVQGGR
jgi:haloalkane dehalogenase